MGGEAPEEPSTRAKCLGFTRRTASLRHYTRRAVVYRSATARRVYRPLSSYWSGFNCFPLMDCPVFREPRPTNCGVLNDALQMLVKKLDRAFLDLYAQRGVQYHVGRTGDRQELERAPRFFESIHQFEAVPEIDVIVGRAVDKK